MRELGILESDLEEIFARSGGPGGQNVNKVSTAVTLRHFPSGLQVTVQDSRSQARNRLLARERIVAAIEKKLPKESADSRPLTDVVEAYVLSRNGQFEKAQSLARKRGGDLAAGNYWRRYPTGEDVLKVWKQLLAPN